MKSKTMYFFVIACLFSVTLSAQFPFNPASFDSLSIVANKGKLKLTSYGFLQNDTTTATSQALDTANVLYGMFAEMSRYYGTVTAAKQYQELSQSLSRGMRAIEQTAAKLKTSYFDYSWATLPKDQRAAIVGNWIVQTADSTGLLNIATEIQENSRTVTSKVNDKQVKETIGQILIFNKEMFMLTAVADNRTNVLFYYSVVQQAYVSYDEKGRLAYIARKLS